MGNEEGWIPEGTEEGYLDNVSGTLGIKLLLDEPFVLGKADIVDGASLSVGDMLCDGREDGMLLADGTEDNVGVFE